jgi:hypothetical protein
VQVTSPTAQSQALAGVFSFDWREMCDDKAVWVRPAKGSAPRLFMYWFASAQQGGEADRSAWVIGTDACEDGTGALIPGSVVALAHSAANSPVNVPGGGWMAWTTRGALQVRCASARAAPARAAAHSLRTSQTHARTHPRRSGADTSHFLVPGICAISLVLGMGILHQCSTAVTKRQLGMTRKYRSLHQDADDGGYDDGIETSSLINTASKSAAVYQRSPTARTRALEK